MELQTEATAVRALEIKDIARHRIPPTKGRKK